MFEITKDFTFSAAHHLNLPNGHPCSRVHGHNYLVRVALRSETINELGMVLDYGDLAPFGEYINATLDHQDLNSILAQPTAENVAIHLWFIFGETVPAVNAFTCAVGVSETPRCWAWYRP